MYLTREAGIENVHETDQHKTARISMSISHLDVVQRYTVGPELEDYISTDGPGSDTGTE